MTGADFGSFILGLIAVAIIVAIAVWLLHWLYLRSSKERAFVPPASVGKRWCWTAAPLCCRSCTTSSRST